ncbi:MAG: NfeD family protein [Clostridia bacterium]|nr:NfeD family protein [Clostridia bacterium]
MQYFWLGVLIASLIVEAVIPGLISIWFVPSALVALVLAFFDVPVGVQTAVFLVMSIVLLVLSRTVWKKYISVKPTEPTNSDALIGKEAIVTEAIDNLSALGEVKIGGQHWSARSENGENIEVGAKVKVLSIEGVKLICKKD